MDFDSPCALAFLILWSAHDKKGKKDLTLSYLMFFKSINKFDNTQRKNFISYILAIDYFLLPHFQFQVFIFPLSISHFPFPMPRFSNIPCISRPWENLISLTFLHYQVINILLVHASFTFVCERKSLKGSIHDQHLIMNL